MARRRWRGNIERLKQSHFETANHRFASRTARPDRASEFMAARSSHLPVASVTADRGFIAYRVEFVGFGRRSTDFGRPATPGQGPPLRLQRKRVSRYKIAGMSMTEVQMQLLYEPARYHVHNDSSVVTGDDVLAIQTPPQRWAYAVTIAPVRSGGIGDGPVATTLKLRVRRGVVGIGVLSADETRFVNETGFAGPSDDWVETTVLTGVGDENGPLVVRNHSGSGSPSEVDIRIIKSVPVTDETMTATPEIAIDPALFDRYTPWSGTVPAGYWIDWTGIRTRADVYAFTPEITELFNTERPQTTALPIYDEHVLDWIPLVQALNETSGTFRMAALGAGWGRWIAGGAGLARQLGRDFKILGVEAEPQHFDWMLRHMRDNDIGADRATLICAAAAGRPGDFWFTVGDSQSWYGQSIVSVDESKGRPDPSKFRRVKGLTMNDVLEQLSPIDYLHMDIQGTEAEFLSYAPDQLNRHVGMVNIGTHGLDIEVQLRALFRKLGWTCIYDIEIGSSRAIRIEEKLSKPVQFGDGVQVWKNPNFPGRRV
jgi:FkbM family methyltransferase